MCLTIPGRVVSIRGEHASVDYGKLGVREDVDISMVSAKVGDYIMVQGGFAIQTLTAKESREALEAWKLVQEQLSETDGGLF